MRWKWYLIAWIEAGGWTTGLLLLLLLVGLMVSAQRAVVLWWAEADLEWMSRCLVRQSPREAFQIFKDRRGPAARVLREGLEHFERSAKYLENAMEARALAEIRSLNRGLGLLAFIASVAPILGLLGSATGWMASTEAFRNYGLSLPNAVADGIVEAVVTTMTGLKVAILASLIHSVLVSRINSIIGVIGRIVNTLLELQRSSLAFPAGVAAGLTGVVATKRPSEAVGLADTL